MPPCRRQIRGLQCYRLTDLQTYRFTDLQIYRQSFAELIDRYGRDVIASHYYAWFSDHRPAIPFRNPTPVTVPVAVTDDVADGADVTVTVATPGGENGEPAASTARADDADLEMFELKKPGRQTGWHGLRYFIIIVVCIDINVCHI